MNKQHILDEIVKTAEKNGGRPLGMKRFFAETGIRRGDWYGKYWARWGDAVREAGYSPNELQSPYDEDWLLEQLITLIRELGRFPAAGDIRMRERSDSTFPSHTTFARLGKKDEIVEKVLNYCREKGGHDDVIRICEAVAHTEKRAAKSEDTDEPEAGFVYLIKSGRYYKIGRSNSAGRREYELSIQLPERVTTEHVIKTDDPAGIEAYWHRRFKEKRKGGEWFELTAQDIKAFKRRKFM